jgi:subtilisin family serine protease
VPTSRRIDFRIPHFQVEHLIVSCSEAVDWSLTDYGIPKLWKKTTGAGIKVAVLDTGCALLHPDLKNQILDAADFTGSRIGPGDTNGHGTHCCGIIAAEKNGVGAVGVAPGSKIIVAKVLNDYGAGNATSIAKGIVWAADKGADVISMSFGSAKSHPVIREAINYAASKLCLLVAAAGNEGPGENTVGFPARYSDVLAVAAVDINRKIAKFSSRGKDVDIAAPGVDILSTYPPKNYAKLSGTSMATPFVAGTLALMLAFDRLKGWNRLASSKDMIEVMKKNAIEAGTEGFDNEYGWGLIDPSKLVTTVAKIKKETKTHNSTAVSLLASDFSKDGLIKLKTMLGDFEGLTLTLDKESGATLAITNPNKPIKRKRK